jgi:quercetin dioxygenase-like cupin family protein
MLKPFKTATLTLLLGGALAMPVLAADAYPTKPLLKTNKTIIGETIVYPTTGPAEVKADIVTIAPGAETVFHRHGVPMFAYILKGTAVVDYGDKGMKTYKPGVSFLEAMTTTHRGTNPGTEPVEILAVYMGAEGSNNVIPMK